MTDIKKYKVVVFDTAKRSIASNYRYISETFDNEPAAFAHTVDIYKEIKKLEYMPKSHKVYEGFVDEIKFEYRVVRVRQYLIFYRIDEENLMVYVVDVMHSHQEPRKFLS